jgi:putative sigma-54 modulation protein
MKISIRGDKLVVTKAIKETIESKLERLNKYFENDAEITAHVVVKAKNLDQSIEVTIPTNRFTLRAEEVDTDLYAAIDKVIDKLERQIRKNKTKLNNKYKNVEKLEMVLDFDVENDEEENIKIVKRKNIEMKPMDEEEAILQSSLLGHDFFVFKNIDEECVSVLYTRKDGSYGIINVK